MRLGVGFAALIGLKARFPRRQVQEGRVRCDCNLNHATFSKADAKSKRTTVAFAWAFDAEDWGSVVTRSHQLASLLLSYDSTIRVVSSSIEGLVATRNFPDVVILNKTALKYRFLEHYIRRAKQNGGVVFFDSVDDPPRRAAFIDHQIDHYLCASKGELQWRSSKGQPASFLAHHVDLRIAPRTVSRERFNLGFVGAPRNVLHLKSLGIDFFDASITQEADNFREFVSFLDSLSHHYSVRHYQDGDGFKPALKAYFAAHLGATFIGSRADPEVSLVLGDSYPYLSSDSSLSSVSQTVALAKSTFGHNLHHLARGRMEPLRKEFCPAGVVAVLHRLIQDVLANR